MKKLAKVALVLALVLGGLGAFAWTQQTHHSAPTGAPRAIEPSGDPIRDGVRKALAWMETRQEADGEFSAGMLDPKPAYTALVCDAAARSPERVRSSTHPWFAKALAAIARHQQEDGGIYTPRLSLDGYCTAISLMALIHAEDASFAQVVSRAQTYVASCQVGPDGGIMAGGFGYSKGASKADLSNTAVALEALRAAGVKEDDPAFKNAVKFIDSVHNDSETNKASWATNDGGSIYRPGESKAGSYTDEKGVVRYKSYGLMSYASLLSFLTAYVDRNDGRVKSSIKWVKSNWDLENNRNLGQKGLFYYYLMMAKALAAYGERTIVTDDGVKHDWPTELAKAILARQNPDGSFQNTDKTWYETDSVLVTAYMIRALSICYEQSQKTGRPEGAPR